MRFKLSNPLQSRQALARLEYLVTKGAVVELTEKKKQRTYSQNSYLHLILTAWGNELGYDLDEMKQVVKMQLLPSMFQYKKRGLTLYKSTASLDTKQMTTLIDKIRLTAQERTEFYIPAPNEHEMLQSLQNEVERFG